MQLITICDYSSFVLVLDTGKIAGYELCLAKRANKSAFSGLFSRPWK